MAADWLAPTLTGGGIGLASSVITFAIQQVADSVKRRGERAEKLRDSGREQAKLVLADIQIVRASSLDGKAPDLETRQYSFNPDEVKKVRNDAALVTDEATRERVRDAFMCLLALGPAEHELEEARYRVERDLVDHAERIVAAYARGDKIPATSVSFVTRIKKTVDDAWNDLT